MPKTLAPRVNPPASRNGTQPDPDSCLGAQRAPSKPARCTPTYSLSRPPKNSILYRIEDWPQRIHDSHYSVGALAATAGYGCSVRNVERFYRYEMGNTPARCMKCVRMKLALEILRGSSNINETAYQLHYAYPANFSRDFKRFYGTSPSDHESIATRPCQDGWRCRVLLANCRVSIEGKTSQPATYLLS